MHACIGGDEEMAQAVGGRGERVRDAFKRQQRIALLATSSLVFLKHGGGGVGRRVSAY